MIDDLSHMREIITKSQVLPTSGDLRRISNPLRRLLIDNGGDLRKIAVPRLDRRLRLDAPDVKRFVNDSRRKRLYFASLGTSGLFGSPTPAFFIEFKYTLIQQPAWQRYESDNAEDAEKLVTLTADGFLSQPVLCYKNVWITRRDVVKYAANVAGGVHHGTLKEDKHVHLHSIRQIAHIYLKNGRPTVSVDTAMITSDNIPVRIYRDRIDLVHFQLMATARYLTISPDVIEIENMIKNE